MRLLELFRGTKSVGKVAEAMGWEVVSVDINPLFDPTIVTDILNWDYTVFKPSFFDLAHASPPCTMFSIARSKGQRDFAQADAIARKTLEIIAYLKPKWFTIENPFKSLIWRREYAHLSPLTLDYCRYSTVEEGFGYRKRSKFWTNVPFDVRLCHGDCENMEADRIHHRRVAQHGARKQYPKHTFSTEDLYRIPPRLCFEILRACEVADCELRSR